MNVKANTMHSEVNPNVDIVPQEPEICLGINCKPKDLPCCPNPGEPRFPRDCFPEVDKYRDPWKQRCRPCKLKGEERQRQWEGVSRGATSGVWGYSIDHQLTPLHARSSTEDAGKPDQEKSDKGSNIASGNQGAGSGNIGINNNKIEIQILPGCAPRR